MFATEDGFFDELYQLWSKTTGAENTFWMPEEHFDKSGRYNVYAVAQDDSRKLVASGLNERDADFLTGIHGALPELVRRLHEAVDEADRADLDKDDREHRIFELELEMRSLQEEYDELRWRMDGLEK